MSVTLPGTFIGGEGLHQEFCFGGFNKFSWGQRAERTGIWGRWPPSQGFHSICKMSETRILIRLLRMYFPENWEFCSALSKLRNFGGGGGGEPTNPLSVRHWIMQNKALLDNKIRRKIGVQLNAKVSCILNTLQTVDCVWYSSSSVIAISP
jgi:hypothetical protein